jgi:hypothetical protein
MSSRTTKKQMAGTPRQTRKVVRPALEKFASEFGPKPGEKPGGSKRVGAVDLLLKLRRGEA